jgi:hypothetical protein
VPSRNPADTEHSHLLIFGAKGTVVKLAAYGFCLFLLALPFAARASENLVAKREACRLEARSRIVLKGKIEVDDYRRIVERRAAYVTQCINRTVVARSDAPLPPQRVLDDATDSDRQHVVTSGRDEPRRMARRANRYKPKMAALRMSKTTKLRGKTVRVSSRRSK